MANGDFVVGRDIDFQYADPEDSKKKVKKRAKKKKSSENAHENTYDAHELSAVWEKVEQNLKDYKPNDSSHDAFFSDKSHPKKPKARMPPLKRDPRKLKLAEYEADSSKLSRPNKKPTKSGSPFDFYRNEGSPASSGNSNSYKSATPNRNDLRTGNHSFKQASPVNSGTKRNVNGRVSSGIGSEGSSNGDSGLRNSYHHNYHLFLPTGPAINCEHAWDTISEEEHEQIGKFWEGLSQDARKQLLCGPDKEALLKQAFGHIDWCACETCSSRQSWLMETLSKLNNLNTSLLEKFSEKLSSSDTAFMGSHLEPSVKSHFSGFFGMDFENLPFEKLDFDDMDNPEYTMGIIIPPSEDTSLPGFPNTDLPPSNTTDIHSNPELMASQIVSEFSKDCDACQRVNEKDTNSLDHNTWCNFGKMIASGRRDPSLVSEENSMLPEGFGLDSKGRGQYESISEMRERTQEQLRTIAQFTNGFSIPGGIPNYALGTNENSETAPGLLEKDFLSTLVNLQQHTDTEGLKNGTSAKSPDTSGMSDLVDTHADFDPAQVEKFDGNATTPSAEPTAQSQNEISDTALKDLTSDIVHNQGLKFLEVYDSIAEKTADSDAGENTNTPSNPFMLSDEEFSKDAKKFVKEIFKQTFMDKVKEAARDPAIFPTSSDLGNPFDMLSLQAVEDAIGNSRSPHENANQRSVEGFAAPDPSSLRNLIHEALSSRVNQSVSNNNEKVGLTDVLKQFDKFLEGEGDGFMDPRTLIGLSGQQHKSTYSPRSSKSKEISSDSPSVDTPPYSSIRNESEEDIALDHNLQGDSDSKGETNDGGSGVVSEANTDSSNKKPRRTILSSDFARILTTAWYLHYLHGRIFEERTLRAYREHVAHEHQQKLLAELEAEEARAADQALRKQREKDKKKSRKLAARQQREEEERKKNEEAARKAQLAREKEEKRRLQQLEADRAKQEAHRRRIEERLSKLALQDDQERKERAKAQADAIDAEAKAHVSMNDANTDSTSEISPNTSATAAQSQNLETVTAVGEKNKTPVSGVPPTPESEVVVGEKAKKEKKKEKKEKKGLQAQKSDTLSQGSTKKQPDLRMNSKSQPSVPKQSVNVSQLQLTGNPLQPQSMGARQVYPPGTPLRQDSLLGSHSTRPKYVSNASGGIYGASIDPSTSTPFVPMHGLETHPPLGRGISTGMTPTNISKIPGMAEVPQAQNIHNTSSPASRVSRISGYSGLPVNATIMPQGVPNIGANHPSIGSVPLASHIEDNEGLPSNLDRGSLGNGINAIKPVHLHQGLQMQPGLLNANGIQHQQQQQQQHQHQQQHPIHPTPLATTQHNPPSAVSSPPINGGVRNLWSVPSGSTQVNTPQASWSRSLWGDDWSDNSQKANANASIGSFIGSSPWESTSKPVWNDKNASLPSKDISDTIRNSYKQVQNTGIDGFVASHVLHNSAQKHLNGVRLTRNEFYKLCEKMEGFECARDEMGLITHIKL